MITEEEVKTLQDIVGPQWVSTASCMMDTYSFFMNPETLVKGGGRWTPRPVAVMLPETTEEVQEIMRFCSTTDLMAKPFSTGFHAVCSASRDRVVILDLKRMNRIIDIDVKNQIAVIEPYVKAIVLQTELMKHGLNVHVVSAGGGHSTLASHTAAWGYGATGPSMGHSGRNLLGVEWVLPTGEVLTLGSGGIGAGWFTADGPGPSLRGIMRGFSGTFGGLGVFTKCAVKLYKWDGPAEVKVRGKSPRYVLQEIPPKIAMNLLLFPSEQAIRDAGYRLGEAEIEYSQFRVPAFFAALGATNNNNEAKQILETGFFQEVAKWALANVVVGYSEREFKWKMKALKEILRETGGISMPVSNARSIRLLRTGAKLISKSKNPFALLKRLTAPQRFLSGISFGSKQDIDSFSISYWVLVRHATNIQGSFRPSQGMSTMLGSFDTWDLGFTQSNWVAEKKKEQIEKGLILDDGGDLGVGDTFEHGHLGYLEGIILYNTKDRDSIMATGQLIDEGVSATINEAMGIPIAGFGEEMNARLGPECRNYHHYLRKIKKALDPNTASDPFFYAEPGIDE